MKMEDRCCITVCLHLFLVLLSIPYLYTLIAEIILRYSNQTVQVLSNNVGP